VGIGRWICDCLRLNPCSRLRIICRISGRYRSRVAWQASCDSVLSRIVLSSPGTLPRSCTLILMWLNARHAMLSSFPRVTYISLTSFSVARLRLHAVKLSSSLFVATRSLVTEESIVLMLCALLADTLRDCDCVLAFEGACEIPAFVGDVSSLAMGDAFRILALQPTTSSPPQSPAPSPRSPSS